MAEGAVLKCRDRCSYLYFNIVFTFLVLITEEIVLTDCTISHKKVVSKRPVVFGDRFNFIFNFIY